MSTLDPREEEELRNFVRRELEARERARDVDGAERRFRSAIGAGSEDRRRIIDEEIERFYRSKGNVRPWENEEGETEWLTDEQIREREAQIPLDEEELESGQQAMRVRVLIMSTLFVLGMILLFFILRDRSGNIQVVSNVQGATIVLDGAETGLVTDAILSKIPTGPHLISLRKDGYVLDNMTSLRVDVRPGQEAIASLPMKYDPFGSSPGGAKDSLLHAPKESKHGR